MDSFQFHASKLDKAHVKLRYKKKLIYRFLRFFRVFEICLISVFVWRKAPRFLWINVKFCKEYLLMFMSGPRTVFLIGNAIILILLAESRQRQNMSSDDVSKPNTDVHEECIQIKDGGGDHKVKSFRKVKSYKRSKSEKAELRRSATAINESCKQLMIVEEEAECGKGMTDDEFRDMVEDFIARQQRNLRQEC